MKRALFNFLVLQLIVWTIVFYDSSSDDNSINHASISDTWEVVSIEDKSDESFILHYPTFQKLTLNENGSFIRENIDQDIERGNWYLNKSKDRLTLMHEGGVKEYDIIQLPLESSQSFIIKENISELSANSDIEYELNRM